MLKGSVFLTQSGLKRTPVNKSPSYLDVSNAKGSYIVQVAGIWSPEKRSFQQAPWIAISTLSKIASGDSFLTFGQGTMTQSLVSRGGETPASKSPGYAARGGYNSKAQVPAIICDREPLTSPTPQYRRRESDLPRVFSGTVHCRSSLVGNITWTYKFLLLVADELHPSSRIPMTMQAQEPKKASWTWHRLFVTQNRPSS